MTELSPAAQAVLDAFGNARDGEYVDGVWVVNERAMLAAALRAFADQVVPDEGDRWTRDLRGDAWIRAEERKLLRRDLLAIAGELKAQ